MLLVRVYIHAHTHTLTLTLTLTHTLTLMQIALVKWTESVGLTLVNRDLASMTTEGPGGEQNCYEILQLFPFTSERKRMGIVVKVYVHYHSYTCRISSFYAPFCFLHQCYVHVFHVRPGQDEW